MKTINTDNLTSTQQHLIEAAIKATDTAYVPYSKYHVGAAVLTKDGSIFSASNVENAAYGSTICAERMAIGKANASGTRDIKAIAISSKSKEFDKVEIASGPCGSCRQFIYEMSQVSQIDIEVIGSTTNKNHITLTTIEKLLPLRKKRYVDLNIPSQIHLTDSQNLLIEAAIKATDLSLIHI